MWLPTADRMIIPFPTRPSTSAGAFGADKFASVRVPDFASGSSAIQLFVLSALSPPPMRCLTPATAGESSASDVTYVKFPVLRSSYFAGEKPPRVVVVDD